MTASNEDPARSVAPAVFACAASARHAPEVVAASLIAAGLIAAWRIEPLGVLPNVLAVRALLVAVGAVAGFRFLLSAREVRIRATLRDEDLLLELGGRVVAVAYGAIAELDYEHAFRRYDRWTPVLVVVDARGERHRIPACVVGGERLVAGLVDRSRCRDLGIRAEALDLRARMRRARRFAATAYVCAGTVVAAAILA